MRVLIVSCVFPPEPVTSATTSADLAAALTDAGHEVTVITAFPNRPGGRLFEGFRRGWRSITTGAESYRLVRTFAMLSPRRSLIEQLLENVTFGFMSTLNSAIEKADVVYINTWPIFAAEMITLMCRMRGIPLVLSIQDVHPEAAIAVGKLSAGGPVTWAMKRIDRRVAHRATALVVISDQFADFYNTERGVQRTKIHVVPNWMDETCVMPEARVGSFRSSHGIGSDRFIAMYAGSIGSVAGVELLLDAAELLRDNCQVLFVIAGDGSERSVLEARVRDTGLTNVLFHWPWRAEDTNQVHAAADVLILPTRRSASRTSVPSKLIAYMLSGRPVLAAVESNSPTARLIAEAKCGVCIPPESPSQMAEQIRAWSAHPDLLADMGNWGRAYAELHCSRTVCLPKLISIIESAGRTAVGAERHSRAHATTEARGSTDNRERMNVQIRPMQQNDVGKVVAVHRRSFPGFFLTFLGPRFLRLVYLEILRRPDHVAYVAQDEHGSVVGFVAGVTEQAGFYGHLARRRWASFALAATPAAVWRPAIIPRLIRALRRSRESRSATTTALLISIAVEAQVAGRGIGRTLVQHFLASMRQRKVRAVSLMTDRDANERTNQFYQRLNFRLVREFVTPEGRWMNEYIADLSDDGCPSSPICQKKLTNA